MASFLVVDDSKIARRMLTTLLTDNGHAIVGEATNGEEGYEKYIKLMPDVIMLDIIMPVLDGIDCLRKIKNDYPEAKAIMVTAIGRDKKKEQAEELGALGYIIKPFDPEEVMDVVDRISAGV